MDPVHLPGPYDAVSETERLRFLVAVHQELSAYMRFRSDPEYLYAAASIAGSGAVAWGITAVAGAYFWAHLVGAIGVLAAAATVCVKIHREHREYEKANLARATTASRIRDLIDDPTDMPALWLASQSEKRHHWSMIPVALWAIVAAAICIATYFG